ncbi:MAG: RimK domain protein ATP-grasp [Actinomycetia bacterium]|nr:RimK domain protein ATP-grasp [Actinomycetes bacterium]
MILLWGVPGDGPLDAVAEELVAIGVEPHVLDQHDGAHITATSTVGAGGELRTTITDEHAATTLDLRAVSAAYLRPHAARDVLGPDDDAMQRAIAADDVLVTWADVADAMIVNRPSAMAVNNSKPYQLALIAQCGLAVPDTLVTTDPAAAAEFWARHGDVVYKSVSGVRSIVSRLGDTHRSRLDDVAHCPTQFQQYIAGTDVRVHVVGDDVFATEVASDADDYRYPDRAGSTTALASTSLPDDVARLCVAMASSMQLHVAGVDLRRTSDDEWFCFEVNPSPGFTYYEEATDQPIAAAIAALLVRAASAPTPATTSARADTAAVAPSL